MTVSKDPKCFILSCVVALAMTNSATAAALAIRAGRIIPVSGPEIENGTVLIEDQKIKALGTDVVIPNDARIIDAKDQTIMPGLIDAQSRLFLLDSELDQGSGAPELDVLDALDPLPSAAAWTSRPHSKPLPSRPPNYSA